MRSFENDKARVDRFEPEIKRILGEHLIATADFERDTKQATDLLVLHLNPISVACRVRFFDWIGQYGDEFTIRAERPNGTRTELRKIYEGWCDYGFYSFADPSDERVCRWTLYSLNIFRDAIKAMPSDGLPFVQKHIHSTHDGSAKFAAFRWDEFPDEMVVASFSVPITSCDNPRCYSGQAWQKSESGDNTWCKCEMCLGTGKVFALATTKDSA